MDRVCFISDDYYFLCGLDALAPGKNGVLHFVDIQSCMLALNRNQYSVFVVCLQSLEHMREIVYRMNIMGLYVVPVFDIVMNKINATRFIHFLSKKECVGNMSDTLRGCVISRLHGAVKCTTQQQLLISQIVSGYDMHFIARMRVSSIKTVYAVRRHILLKLGLAGLNDISMIMADIIIKSIQKNTFQKIA